VIIAHSWDDDPEFVAELERRSNDLEGSMSWEELRGQLRPDR
jgi:hypothetical protein